LPIVTTSRLTAEGDGCVEFARRIGWEKYMTGKSQPGKIQSVLVVEADILDRMNETDASIAQRAYEIYESRGSVHGADQDDWFTAEQEILRPLSIERYVTDGPRSR